jgi:drug/metabolite transporter (DMT)-like permease
MHPSLFLALRFWIGVLLLTPLLFRERNKFRPGLFWRGFLLGVFMFLGMFCQTLGLKYTTATNSGFLTSMSVILVPIWAILFHGKFPRNTVWIGIALAAAGVMMLTRNPAGGHFNRGDFFTLLSAVSFSFQIILIEMFVKKDQSFIYAWMMLFWTAFFASLAAALTGQVDFMNFGRVLWNLAFLGIVATALAFWAQTYFQPKTSATAAAIIYATEPIFAAFFAMVWIGERLSSFGWIGASLILSGFLVHESGALANG